MPSWLCAEFAMCRVVPHSTREVAGSITASTRFSMMHNLCHHINLQLAGEK